MAKLNRWEIVSSTGSHFDVLDGLRGVAILLVVAHHTLYVNQERGLFSQLMGCVIEGGWMGVPIFFVLSGFLISYPFLQKRDVNPQFWYQRGYAWRRLAKILPPFYLSILLLCIFFWCQFHDAAYFRSAWQWAIGLGAFITVVPGFNPVYWSLMIESQYYIVLPALFWLTRGLSVRRTGLIIFSVLFTVPLIARQFMWPENVYVSSDFSTTLFVDLLMKLRWFPCQLDYFAWGVLFAAAYVSLSSESLDKLRIFSVFGYVGIGLMAATLILWGLWVKQFNIGGHLARWSVEVSHLLPAAATMLMLFFVFDRQCLGSRLLSLGWIRLVGIVSYEWFLLHFPVVDWFARHSGHTHGSLLAYSWRCVLPLVLTFGLAVIMYRWFSLPILSAVRDRLKTNAARPGI